MNVRKWIAENAATTIALILFVGITLILAGKLYLTGTAASLAETLGVSLATIVTAAFLYEKILAEKHFELFEDRQSAHLKELSGLVACQMGQIEDILKRMDNIQSTCTRMGITEVFDDRTHYETKYPMPQLFGTVKPGGRILAVGRTMLHFMTKPEAIIAALERGAKVQIACLGSPRVDPVMKKICYMRGGETLTPLQDLEGLVAALTRSKYHGTLEFKTHSSFIPESLVLIEQADRSILIWDMTFGRSLPDKKVFIVELCNSSFSRGLLARYEAIWDSGQTCVKVNAGGAVEKNDLTSLLQNFGQQVAEQHAGQVSSEAAPSAAPNEPSA